MGPVRFETEPTTPKSVRFGPISFKSIYLFSDTIFFLCMTETRHRKIYLYGVSNRKVTHDSEYTHIRRIISEYVYTMDIHWPLEMPHPF